MELLAGEPNFIVEHVSVFLLVRCRGSDIIYLARIELRIHVRFHQGVLEFSLAY